MKTSTYNINLKGLPENYTSLIRDFVEYIRSHYKTTTQKRKRIIFATRKLGVKNHITREQIYDYL
jgi:hypothetical protein